MTQVKTTLAKSHPFAPKGKPQNPVDISTLTISNDPIPAQRSQPPMKYESLFSQLQHGQCIVCETAESSKIGHALNTWLDKKGRRDVVKTMREYPVDGKGRVWLLPPVARSLKSAA